MRKTGLFCMKNQIISKFWLNPACKVWDARTFSNSVIIEKCIADENILLTEVMIAENQKIVLRRIEFGYPGESCKYAIMDKFRATGFRSEEPNRILDSRVEN